MSLEQTIGNLEIRYANVVTFVGTSNTMVDTTTGRIQTKGFQHNSNVITDISGPHGRVAPTLKKYPEIAFEYGKLDANETTFTYTQAGYTVKGTNSNTGQTSGPGPGRTPWKVFSDPNDGGHWQPTGFNHDTGNNGSADNVADAPVFGTGNTKGAWVSLELPKKIKVQSVYINSTTNTEKVRLGKLYGSNNNSDWVTIKDDYTLTYSGTSDIANDTVNSTIAYKYIVFQIRATGGAAQVQIDKIRYYGYEEDPPAGDHSVDTTFMSRFNNPQLTGVKVLVDGGMANPGTNQISGGADPSGNNSIYDATNKYYTLNGTLTSNLSVEANTFLEGDQPHAVSVWFNSSNLEANVSNTCVFSISDQEKLDSQNLDLQSNTWHNLTYTYQGEGGSRVTYLDGRKVAEDQAEDTFGDYPPFAMTGYAQGGYVVSASSSQSGYEAWAIFDQYEGGYNNGGWWQISGSMYSTSGNYDYISGSTHNLGTSTGSSTSTDNGHWVKIEMPHKLKLSYVNMKCQQYHEQGPKDFKFYGSKNNKDWELIKSFTNATPLAGRDYTINSTVGYKAIGLVVTAINGHPAGQLALSDIQLYGHRENDLVRLPDPTNVLKYPHISIPSSYTKRGYVVSASNDQYVYGANNIEARGAWAAFGNTGSEPGWQLYYDGSSNAPYASSADGSGFYQNNALASTLTGTSHRGEWIKLELPHKLMVQKMKTDHGSQPERLGQVILLGSNNDSDWYTIKDTFALTTASAQTTDINATVAYKYIVLIVKSLQNASINVDLKNLEFYGTGVDSVPIQIGGGNIDKVANFRVYDTFVGEDQALEIWDAQKDYFGRAKSQMVLQQGKLGVGTDAPQGRFSVADEPHVPEEFPPRAGGFDGDEWYIEGHGTFKACTSSYHDNRNYYPGRAFTKSLVINFGFATLSDGTVARWSGNGGLPNQSSSDPVGTFQGHQGDWLELELPYRIRVKSFQIQTRITTYSPGDHPKNGFLYGSNNRENWTQITEFTNLSYTPSQLDGIGAHKAIWNINSETGFKYLRLLTTQKIDGSDAWLMISELKYFGTREQGQSVLHDGQLTLTKSLNVPRIGPPLDADDTPRRDRLVVEYNTSTNPTFEGAVRDTSGRGLDGVFTTGAGYDANEKVLTFNGATTSGITVGGANGLGGDRPFSVSLWFNASALTGGVDNTLVSWGEQSSQKSFFMTFDTGDNKIHGQFFGNGMAVQPSGGINLGIWYHTVLVYPGGGHHNMSIYVNGVIGTNINSGSNTGGLVPEDPEILIGTYRNSSNQGLNGSISQFKLYDTTLTAEEVKTLYDMGRCDEGHHVVNFSKTRVGIGLGDGEAPRGALDVGGGRLCTNRVVVGGGGKEALDLPGISGGEIHVHQRGYAIGTTLTDNVNMANTALTMHAEGANGNPWSIGVGDGYRLIFCVNTNVKGYIANTSGAVQANFTGQHRTFIKDVPFSQTGDLEGLIVSADNNKYIKMSGGIEAGSNAITTNESLPVVSLSSEVCDKKCFGVISEAEDPEQRSDAYGSFVTPFDKEKGDTRVFINSVGEGAIWVSNIGGSLESGDYITTSNVAGYGQKQDSDSLKNYTVAKITMDCDFNPATQPIQQILRSNVIQTYYLGDVHKVKSVPHEFVTTTVGVDDTWSNVSIDPSNVAYAEWSNLEANTQNTYTLTYTQTSNVVYDTKYTLTTTANVTESDTWDRVSIDPPGVTYAEYSNLEANTQSSYSLTFTKTTTDTKTPGAWSALESNTQSLYNEDYYQSVEEEVASDYTGATTHTRVTDVIENELDVHGQIQWEDHSTETEKAYKIRYLDVSGTQTDSTNAVHIAAFVGCTYHCG